MIIDLILDRKDGYKYNVEDFYRDCVEYGEVGFEITRALDSGTEKDVKQALCDYIIENGYNKNICKYINSVNWLDDDYYESKKSAKKSLKESKIDYVFEDLANEYADEYCNYHGGNFTKESIRQAFLDGCNDKKAPKGYHEFVAWQAGQRQIGKKSLKEKLTVAKSLKIIEHALLDLIHNDTIQEEFNMAFEDNGIYDSVDDMFEVSVHNVLNKLLKEYTITVLPF